MRVLCNGSNLFRQLNVQKPIIEELTKMFEFEVIEEIFLNQSYSIVLTPEKCLVYQNEGVLDLIPKNDISLITCNDDGIILVNRRGEIMTAELSNFSNITSANYRELDGNNNIRNIATGSKLTVFYTSDGRLCKVLDRVPQTLEFHCDSICDMKCGKEHCLLLDGDGNVYSFGTGSRGQLGHGKLDNESEPRLVEALAGIKIKRIATGGWHSCAVSQDGDLYVWGWNSNGQLGLGKEEGDAGFVSAMATPHLVDFCQEDLNALRVGCGSRHTIVFLDNKQLYGCGWNKYHQLSKETRENYYKLTHLHDFEDDDVLDLRCGPWNSAVICK